MSRQKGSRPRPIPEQRKYHEQFTRPARRAAPRAALTPLEPISRRRRWAAALGATLVLVFAFTGVVTAIVQQDRGDDSGARAAAALAAVMVPVAFTVLTRVSRTPHPFRAVVLATPLSIAGYLALGALAHDPTSSLVLSFGIAGAFVLRADPIHRLALRMTAVAVAATLTLLLAVVAPVAAVSIAAFLPFPAVVAADVFAEAQQARR
jgi:hypothetical protein